MSLESFSESNDGGFGVLKGMKNNGLSKEKEE